MEPAPLRRPQDLPHTSLEIRGSSCKIAFVRTQLLQTPLLEGAYVAIQRTGGRFCNRGFGNRAQEIPGQAGNDGNQGTEPENPGMTDEKR